MNMQNTLQINTSKTLRTPLSNSRGFMSGCLTFIIIVLLLLGGLIYWARSAFRDQVILYTDIAPQFSPALISESEATAVASRIVGFYSALETDTKAQSLVLTSNDLNAFIRGMDTSTNNENDLTDQNNTDQNSTSQDVVTSMVNLSSMIMAEIANDSLKIKICLPLNQPPLSLIMPRWVLGIEEDRFFNLTAVLKTINENDSPEIEIESVIISNQTVPREIVDEIKAAIKTTIKEKSAEQQRPTDLESILSKLKSIVIADGKMTVTPK